MKPTVPTARAASDSVAMAAFGLLAPGFKPVTMTWLPATIEALARVVGDLEAERDRLVEVERTSVA